MKSFVKKITLSGAVLAPLLRGSIKCKMKNKFWLQMTLFLNILLWINKWLNEWVNGLMGGCQFFVTKNVKLNLY